MCKGGVRGGRIGSSLERVEAIVGKGEWRFVGGRSR